MLFIFFSLSTLLVSFCLAQGKGSPSNLKGTQAIQQPIPKFYSSTFTNPVPPLIQTEFRANFMQHKFDVNVNHITAGFPEPAEDPWRQCQRRSLEISMFDFRNTTGNGTLVANTLLTFDTGAVNPTCSSFFVAPFVELFPADFLAQSNAVFAGVQQDDLYGAVDTWTFHKGDDLQVTFFLDSNNTLVRFDFASSNELRTFATTRFFNIIPGPVNATVFESSCH
ncbi:hypothetical protein CPC08DRAFT_818173 [Agrocybe pediades]|nr:hypothetical protein CPC08DRAFT_818173 [Agrocybe pediades]